MTEFQGVSVSDLKLVFNRQQQQQQQQQQQEEQVLTPTRTRKLSHLKTKQEGIPQTSSIKAKRTVLLQEEESTNEEDTRVVQALERENKALQQQLLEAQYSIQAGKALAASAKEQQRQDYEEQVTELRSAVNNSSGMYNEQKSTLEERNETIEAQHATIEAQQEELQLLNLELEEQRLIERENSTCGITEESTSRHDATANEDDTQDDAASPSSVVVVDAQASQQQLVAESQRDLNVLFQKMEASRDEASRAQIKLVEQIKRSNDLEEQLCTSQQKVEQATTEIEQLTAETSSLQDKLEHQIQAIELAELQVQEMEEVATTQQIQIESLSMVNRELQRERLQQERERPPRVDVDDEGDIGNDSDSLESVLDTIPKAPSSQIEELEHLWDEQRSQMAHIQHDQDLLFQKLGKSNSESASKIDELCDSIGDLSSSSASALAVVAGGYDGENSDETKTRIDRVSAERLDVIYESERSGLEDDAKLEEFEAAWTQQASKIEAIQRDQEEVLSRLREKSCDATSRLLSLSDSIDEEDLQVDHSKSVRQKQNGVLQAMQQDSKRLLQKIQVSEATAASQIQQLEEALQAETIKAKDGLQTLHQLQQLQESEVRSASQIEQLEEALEAEATRAEELACRCESQESTEQALLSENESLVGQVESLKEMLSETETIYESQKLSVARLEQVKVTKIRELKVQQTLLDKVEAVATQQRETMDCLRSERLTLEQALDDYRMRTKEVQAVSKFQKAMISGLQGEKTTLTKRLLDTEEDFRKHLSGNLNIHAQIAEMRNNIADAIVGSADKDKGKLVLSVEESPSRSFEDTETTMESLLDDDEDGEQPVLVASACPEDAINRMPKSASSFSSLTSLQIFADKTITDDDDSQHPAEEILRLLSFAG